jgi:F-type H+-transporting ATPase subunit b
MLRSKFSFFVIVLALCALFQLAPARLEAAGHEEHQSSGEEEEKKPDLFGKAADLGIWTIVVFLLLVVVLGKYAWKPLMEGLDKREKSIHDALTEAKQAREDALKLREQHQAQMNAAAEQVRSILEEGRRNSQQAADEMIARARAESQAERDRVRREMEVAREQALQELTGWAAQLATLISTKTISRQLNLDDHRRFVDEALADMKQTGAELERQTSSLA